MNIRVFNPKIIIVENTHLSANPRFSTVCMKFTICKMWANTFTSEVKWSEVVAQSCPTLCDPTDGSLHQAPPSMGFSRQEYWSGLPFLSPGDLPNPGIEPRSPALQADILPSKPPGKPSMRDECNCPVVWTFFSTATLGIGMRIDLFQFRGHCWVFQISWHI